MAPHRALLVALTLLALVGCGRGTDDGSAGDSGSPSPSQVAPPSAAGAADGQRHPDIVEVEITPAGERTYDLAVTVSSPYDSPERYADGWRVLAPDGTELGSHTLMHDHAGEQPFTRTQSGLEIPADVAEVTVEGHDQRYGYGGETVTVQVPSGG